MYYFDTDRMMSEGLKVSFDHKIEILKEQLECADAIVIGAGSGLSTSAGYTYAGQRFHQYFDDFYKTYGISDMYSGGFYPFDHLELFWGFWCRQIWVNRYAPIPSNLYQKLYAIVKEKEYFVLTTNVDHCFQRSGFEKQRLYYTQGDYGLFQSSHPQNASLHKTYDNYESIRQMIEAQGFTIGPKGELLSPTNKEVSMYIPAELIPVCEDDGQWMTTNLRIDNSFVEDEGWHQASNRYHAFLTKHEGAHILYLELGVGMNTPVIIKYPFWQYTKENPHAFYACLNKGEAYCPQEIANRSICIDGDIGAVLQNLTT